jgi:hypothetical protein
VNFTFLAVLEHLGTQLQVARSASSAGIKSFSWQTVTTDYDISKVVAALLAVEDIRTAVLYDL